MSISRQHLVPASPTIPSDRSNRALPQYPVPTHPPPHRQHPSPIHNRDAALSGHFANGRMPIPSPAPLDAPRYYHHPSPVVDPESMRDPKAASSSMKKRPRSGSQVQPPRSSDQPPPSGPSRNSVKKKDTKDTVESPGGPPAVLTREKKQKACGNCRRAKLKCIIEGGEGDCIRCKARKEKCIFYPRSNDEDWQQNLTTDVYSTINHLAHLSAAVHHMMSHLTAQRIIPPFSTPDMPNGYIPFEPPERDLSSFQGWVAERGNQVEDTVKGKKRYRGREEEVDNEYEDERMRYPPVRRQSGPSGLHPPPNQHGWSSISYPPPPPLDAPHHHIAPNLPPLRASYHPSTIQLTPTSELDQSRQFFSILPPLSTASPSIPTHVTPTSIVSSSPAGPASGSFQPIYAESQVRMEEPALLDPGTSVSAATDAKAQEDENGDPILGCEDPRQNVITKNLVPPAVAKVLVDYFHTHMSPILMGYSLRHGHFPYLSAGPTTMTPFILGVLCLHAAQRNRMYTHLYHALNSEVTQTLLRSPADSWTADPKQKNAINQNQYGNPNVDPDDPNGPDMDVIRELGGTAAAVDDADDELDPELGIGPEEIVAACCLAMFRTNTGAARLISRHAFRWARGWVKILRRSQPDDKTLGELVNWLPPERKPTDVEMARVWLFCYVVDGIERFHEPDLSPPCDHVPWCELLVPSDRSSGRVPDPADIVLAFHARLVRQLRDWLSKRQNLSHPIRPGPNFIAYKRLVTQTNAALDWWHDEIEMYGLDGNRTRQVEMLWLYAKATINTSASHDLGELDERLKVASMAVGSDAAFTILQRCSEWEPREDLVNLPTAFVTMITLAGATLLDAVKEVYQTQNWRICSVGPHDIIPLLHVVSEALYIGALPHDHPSRNCAQMLVQYQRDLMSAEQIGRI